MATQVPALFLQPSGAPCASCILCKLHHHVQAPVQAGCVLLHYQSPLQTLVSMQKVTVNLFLTRKMEGGDHCSKSWSKRIHQVHFITVKTHSPVYFWGAKWPWSECGRGQGEGAESEGEADLGGGSFPPPLPLRKLPPFPWSWGMTH